MIRNGLLTVLTFLSAIFFPWQFTAFLALIAVAYEPLVPCAVGLFVDTLYFVPHSGVYPLFTFYGLIVSVLAVLVRRQLRTGIIR